MAAQDQLHIDMHGISRPLHAAFEQVGYAELLADLPQVVGRAFVFLGGSPRDDFERSDFRQPGEDFILNAVGEIRIRFFVAQIFERKDGDALI